MIIKNKKILIIAFGISIVVASVLIGITSSKVMNNKAPFTTTTATSTESVVYQNYAEESTTQNVTTTEPPTKNSTETTTKKISSTTFTTKKVETTTKKYTGSPHSTYVKANANLTWEEAYHDNGDGTFTITYVSGEVKTYAPHLVNEGEYVVYDESYENSAGEIGFTIEGWKNLWNMQWCERCHRLTADYGTGEEVCISYICDTNCHYCGEWVTAHSCHSCKK